MGKRCFTAWRLRTLEINIPDLGWDQERVLRESVPGAVVLVSIVSLL
jgi:hypothetical protein